MEKRYDRRTIMMHELFLGEVKITVEFGKNSRKIMHRRVPANNLQTCIAPPTVVLVEEFKDLLRSILESGR